MKKLHYKNRELPYLVRLAICPLFKAMYIVAIGYSIMVIALKLALFLSTKI